MNLKSIRVKFALFIGGPLLIIFIILTTITSLNIKKEMLESTRAQLVATNSMLLESISIFYDQSLRLVMSSFEQFKMVLYSGGDFSVDSGTTVAVTAVNQITRNQETVDLPLLTYDGKRVYGNFELVDGIVKKADIEGLTATVFQAFDKGLIRVTTTVKTLEGQRAVNTYIPADSEVYKTLASGRTYSGRAYVVSGWYWTVYEPIIENGRMIGAIFIGIDETVLLESLHGVLNITIGETGKPFIIGADGAYVHHDDEAREGSSALTEKADDGFEFIKAMLKDKNGVAEFDLGGETMLYSFGTFPNTEWLVVSGSKQREFLESQRRVILYLTVTNVGALALIALVIVLITGVLSKDIVFLKEMMVDERDLTKHLSLKRKDELGLLAGFMNAFIDNLRGIIDQVKTSTIELSSSNNELASTTEELSSTFTQQSIELRSINESISTIKNNTDKVEQNLEKVGEQTDNTVSKTKEGARKLDESMRIVTEIKSSVTELATTVKGLSESSDQIGDIIGVIDDIADQTNLLALNAAIEAARAGEAGRGFAVVADEVRKLAEKTQSATHEIDKIINLLQSETKSVTGTMGKAAGTVESGVQIIAAAKESFDDIVYAMDEIKDVNGAMAESVTEQTGALVDISSRLDSLTTGIEQSTFAVQTVSETVAHLQRQANDLMGMTKGFKTE